MYTWIPMAVTAAASLFNGYSQSKTSSDNAANIQATAYQNYASQQEAGQQTAALQTSLSKFNASLALQQGEQTAGNLRAVADFNSSLILSTAAYNSSLLDQKMDAEWEAYGLQALRMENDFRSIQGSTIATQSASGTVIGEGSNADIVIDNAAQHALDQTILRHNADTVAADLLNAQAQNNWTAQNEARKINWEAEVGATVSVLNSRYQAAGIATQGLLDSKLTIINSRASASSTLSSGSSAATQLKNTSGQQIVSGFISAAGSAASTYAAYTAPKNSITQPGSSLATG